MKLNTEFIQPTASDFGNYVYCGAKLFLDKEPSLASFRKAKHLSYDMSEKTRSRLIGQQNEYRCIEWISKKYNLNQRVIFDGTGKNNQQFFVSKIIPFNVTLQCRPDLIINMSNQNILYEFKAVSKPSYLWYSEYDSNHAQIWCYKFIQDYKIDKYFLFRYFEDPFTQGAYPREIELTDEDLDNEKFSRLFEKYLNVIEVINKYHKFRNKEYNLDLNELNRPVNQPHKCHHCIYFGNYCTPECDPII